MKRGFILFSILLMVFLSAAPTTSGTYQGPIIKPGTYFVYLAKTNESVDESSLIDSMGSGNLFFSLRRDGKPVSVSVYGNGSVEFRVVSVADETAIIQIVLSGTDALVRYSGNISPFWEKKDLISSRTRGNTTRIAVRTFKITGAYRLNTQTGEVYDLKGKPYGRTLLFYGQDMGEGRSLFTAPDGSNVSIFKATPINLTVITYYRKFLPPVIQIATTPYTVSTDYMDARGKSILTYDPGSGLLLSYFGFSWADFQAAGFPILGGIDRTGFSFSDKDAMFAPGLVLADTNALKNGSTVEYSSKTSPLLYPYAVLLLSVVVLGFREVKGWGGS